MEKTKGRLGSSRGNQERLEPAELETGIAGPYLALPMRLWQPPQMHLPLLPSSLAGINGAGIFQGPHLPPGLSRNPEAGGSGCRVYRQGPEPGKGKVGKRFPEERYMMGRVARITAAHGTAVT